MTCFCDVTEFRAFKVEAWRGVGWWGARFGVFRDKGKPIGILFASLALRISTSASILLLELKSELPVDRAGFVRAIR